MSLILATSAYAEDKIVLKLIPFGNVVNPLFLSQTTKISLLFCVVLLAVVLIFVLIDFGAVGITIGSILALIIPMIFKIIPLHWSNIMSLIIMLGILLWKMR